MKKTEKLADLIRFCSRGEMLTEFDGDCFSQFVERVVIHERNTAAFELKCGLILKEMDYDEYGKTNIHMDTELKTVWRLIDEGQAEQVRTLFSGYLSGLALVPAAEAAGLTLFHSGAKDTPERALSGR